MAVTSAPPTPLATSRQVADYLSISIRTLDDLHYRGIGPHYIRVGRHRRYRWDDVERYLTARERSVTTGDRGPAA